MLNPRKLWVARSLDAVLKFIFSITRQATEPRAVLEDCSHIKTILLMESHLIGDTVMAQPLIASLRQKFPEAYIEVFGNPWAKPIFLGDANVDGVTTVALPWISGRYRLGSFWKFFRTIWKIRRQKFDLAIDSRGDIRNILSLWMVQPRYLLSTSASGGVYLLSHVAPVPKKPIPLVEEKFCAIS